MSIPAAVELICSIRLLSSVCALVIAVCSCGCRLGCLLGITAGQRPLRLGDVGGDTTQCGDELVVEVGDVLGRLDRLDVIGDPVGQLGELAGGRGRLLRSARRIGSDGFGDVVHVGELKFVDLVDVVVLLFAISRSRRRSIPLR